MAKKKDDHKTVEKQVREYNRERQRQEACENGSGGLRKRSEG